MNKPRNIWFLIAAVTAIALLAGCSKRQMDDPRVIRAREIIARVVAETGLPDGVEIEMKIDRKLPENGENPGGEAFRVDYSGRRIRITASGAAGLLYGARETAGVIRSEKGISGGIEMNENPKMNLRGIGLLLMKLGTYNYPVTPEEFPFFYDRELWVEYLDFMEKNRYNYIAFWNGHPFSYFVKLPDYPEAQEGMSAGLLERNREQLHWLIREAGKRNIRIFFEFYNIHTSVYFQKFHNLPVEIREPSDLLAGITSYSIEQFCREFPEAGLYITAGEALSPEYSDSWVNDVIMPAVDRAGTNPPVILRSWFLDLEHAEKITRKHPEIYIERKYNVEMIAGTEIDPANKTWDDLTGKSIVNIHMAANLEPFRWNPAEYIRGCMISSLGSGAEGIHLYPRKSWRWPYGCEKEESEYQWVRDLLWYEIWARYAWDPRRNPREEKDFWTRRLEEDLGSLDAATLLLESFELSADALPAIQRIFWAGDDNHTVVTAGLLVSEIESADGIPFLSADTVMPVKEYLDAAGHLPPPGKITPDSLLNLKITDCELALEKIDKAIVLTANPPSWINACRVDMEATLLTTRFYREKLQAVMYRNKLLLNPDLISNRDEFVNYLGRSVEIFRELTSLTSGVYESLSDVPALHPVKLNLCPYHWSDLLPVYEEELKIYMNLLSEIGGADFSDPVFGGLAGIWYGDPGLKRPKCRFVTDRLDYNWETDEDKPEGGRNWSVGWFGYIEGPADGEVVFFAEADQTLRVKIGEQVIIDKTLESGSLKGKFNSRKGVYYPFEILYNHTGAVAGNISIRWDTGSGVAEDIEAKFLSHSRAEIFRMDRMLIHPAEQMIK